MLQVLIDKITEQGDTDLLYLSYTADNIVAERLYENFGFRKAGKVIEGEIVVRLDF